MNMQNERLKDIQENIQVEKNVSFMQLINLRTWGLPELVLCSCE